MVITKSTIIIIIIIIRRRRRRRRRRILEEGTVIVIACVISNLTHLILLAVYLLYIKLNSKSKSLKDTTFEIQ
jgi:hypothetical protein